MNDGSGCDRSSMVQQFGSSRGGGQPKVLLLWLFRDVAVSTDGSTTPIPLPFDHPSLRKLGPLIARFRVWWEAVGALGDFEGGVTMTGSLTGLTWTSPFNVAGPFFGASPTSSAWYTTDANFWPELRGNVEIHNKAGGSTAILHGRLNVALEIELKS